MASDAIPQHDEWSGRVESMKIESDMYIFIHTPPIAFK